MTDVRVPRVLVGAALALLFTTLVVAGYWLLFTTFMIYDDEGFVLVSLKNFSAHGRLYDSVYTQYGPFLYLLYDGLHRLFGFAFDNTSGRWITLVNWAGTSAVCAWMVLRNTRSSVLAAYTLAGTFTYLWVMVHEPIHPGGLITFAIALATWLGAEAVRRDRIDRFVLVNGLICAALLMTKINTGVFFGGACALWLSLHLAPASRARKIAWGAAIGCTVLPYALMHVLFPAPWVRIYMLVFAAGSLGVLLVTSRFARPVVSFRHTAMLAAWTSLGILVLGAMVLLRETSLRGLIAGVLIDPLKQPSVYFFPVRWRPGTMAIAIASLSLAALAARRNWWERPWFQQFIAVLRGLVAIACLVAPLGLIPTTLAVFGLSYGVTLAWCFVVPLGSDRDRSSVRAWVAMVLVFESLQAYPVAGSQLNWGTFLWLALVAMGLHDAVPIFSAWVKRFAKPAKWCAITAVLVPSVFMAQRLARTGWNNYENSQRLELSGAESLRLPNDLTYALRIANENLRVHADVLFSFPGLYSANLWTGLPTPTEANATHWFSLLSTAKQQEIIARLETAQRPAILVQRDLLDYLARQNFRTTGPLHDWITEHFEKAVAFGGYEIWIRRHRAIAALWTARAVTVEKDVLESLVITTGKMDGPVDRVEICNIDAPENPLVTYSRENARFRSAQCDWDGSPTESFSEKVDRPRASPALLELHFSPLRVTGGFNRLLVVLRDKSGSRLGDVLIAHP